MNAIRIREAVLGLQQKILARSQLPGRRGAMMQLTGDPRRWPCHEPESRGVPYWTVPRPGRPVDDAQTASILEEDDRARGSRHDAAYARDG